MRSHAPPAAITLFAIGMESMRLPSGPLSEPPFLAPGTLNCTTHSLYLASAGDSPSAPAGDSEIQETTTAAEPKALTIEEERAIALVKEQEELTKKEDMEQAQFKAKIFIGGIGKGAAEKNEMKQALAQAASPDPDEPKPEEREVRHHRPRMRMMM